MKLAGVSLHVPVSTLNAIEHGRMVPSLSMADAISTGLDLPPGSLDLPLLASVRDVETRSRLLERLLGREVPTVKIQEILRRVSHSSAMPRIQQQHAQLLLAELLGKRGGQRRAVILLRNLIYGYPALRGKMPSVAFSMLGRFYLQLDEPQHALEYLLRVAGEKSSGAAWESAMCNLGLAWWKLGQYRMAESQWRRAIKSVTTPTRLANAHFGLGLVAFRRRDFEAATLAYQETLRLYDECDVPASMRLPLLNNFVACHIQQGAWTAAEDLVHRAPDLAVVDALPRGEWLSTLAEMAWAQGHRQQALALLRQAKDAISNATVVSWFTVRFMEMTIRPLSTARSQALMGEIESRIPHVHDREVRLALYVMLAGHALQVGHLDKAAHSLNTLRTMLPVF
ncbi:MAG: tetratricopeptide repeat protein [Thermaerobacter sp.]|nr:tetratricopeptide repeat protein [Thermaerobacter sp.]